MEEATLEEMLQTKEHQGTTGTYVPRNVPWKGTRTFSHHRPDWKPQTTKKRGSKSQPREISSKHPVPIGRERCLGLQNPNEGGRSVRAFDPRFEDHCGDLREEHVERNYSFVNSMKQKYKRHLQEASNENYSDERAAIELKRIEEEEVREKTLARRKEILKSVRTKEKEAVKRGKKPYFLKQSDYRRIELEAKFEDVKKKGGVSKYIEKRRRRIASKDRKLLPSRRPTGEP